MLEFAEKLMQALLSWTQNIYAWFWDNAMNSGESGFADWFADNWIRVIIAILIIGVALDFLVWMRRYGPFRKQIPSKADHRGNARKDDFEDDFTDDFADDLDDLDDLDEDFTEEMEIARPKRRREPEPLVLNMDEEIGLSDNIVSSVQDIVTRERVDTSAMTREMTIVTAETLAVSTEMPVIPAEAPTAFAETPVSWKETPPPEPFRKEEPFFLEPDLLEEIPHVHVKSDALRESAKPAGKGAQFGDFLARGSRLLQRRVRAARLRMRLKFSGGRED